MDAARTPSGRASWPVLAAVARSVDTSSRLTNRTGRTTRSCGSCCSCWWSGGLLSSVGITDQQCAVGSEGELPVFVVDGMVVAHTQRKKIVDVRQSVVAPPDDVVQF